jgi:proteasome lid subunit RPN8/RPN11
MAIMLSSAAAAAIAAHAESIYPNECVGLLLGRIVGDDKQALSAYAVENSWQGQVALTEAEHEHSQRDRFYLDPRDYLKADRQARAQGLDIVGCYHSHPDHPAQPSERDRVGAGGVGGGSGFSFLIQSVREGSAAELTSWLLLDTGAHFVQEEVTMNYEEEETWP